MKNKLKDLINSNDSSNWIILGELVKNMSIETNEYCKDLIVKKFAEPGIEKEPRSELLNVLLDIMRRLFKYKYESAETIENTDKTGSE